MQRLTNKILRPCGLSSPFLIHLPLKVAHTIYIYYTVSLTCFLCRFWDIIWTLFLDIIWTLFFGHIWTVFWPYLELTYRKIHKHQTQRQNAPKASAQMHQKLMSKWTQSNVQMHKKILLKNVQMDPKQRPNAEK